MVKLRTFVDSTVSKELPVEPARQQGSGYPHADTPWPHTQEAVTELFSDVPDDEMLKITRSNAEELFKFPLSQRLIDEQSAKSAS